MTIEFKRKVEIHVGDLVKNKISGHLYLVAQSEKVDREGWKTIQYLLISTTDFICDFTYETLSDVGGTHELVATSDQLKLEVI